MRIAALALAGLASLGFMSVAGLVPPISAAKAEKAVAIPPSTTDVAPGAGNQVAVLAGGCFWGVEAVFEQVKGVNAVTSGYAGGTKATATYSQVSTERTGHAEAVRIVYDPRVVSYATLLRVYFAVAHDPTQLNRQGPDVGPSYRSAIFPQSAQQKAVASAYIAQLRSQFSRPIVTRIEGGKYYRAEAYHQDFMRRNPAHPYILAHDRPKIVALKRAAPSLFRS